MKISKVKDSLVITINTKSLDKAAQLWLYGELDYDQGVFKIHREHLIKNMIAALTNEEEDGTTLVHTMLDKSFDYILEQGLESFEETY